MAAASRMAGTSSATPSSAAGTTSRLNNGTSNRFANGLSHAQVSNNQAPSTAISRGRLTITGRRPPSISSRITATAVNDNHSPADNAASGCTSKTASNASPSTLPAAGRARRSRQAASTATMIRARWVGSAKPASAA